jgi:hypothetical protein
VEATQRVSLRLFKLELQPLADETGLSIAVSHLLAGKQVEQDRALPVCLHQQELARATAHQPAV